MKNITRLLWTASAVLFIACGSAYAQGTVTQHAIPIGQGAGFTGFKSLLCANAQLVVGQTAADPLCKTVAGDVTMDNTGTFAIGASKVTNSMLAGSIAASKLVGSDIATVGTVTTGTWSATTIAINKGGTGQTTAAAARASSGLNVEAFTGHGDSIYAIQSTDRIVGTNAAFTASRTWTLPAANAVNPGGNIIVADFQGTVTGTNTLVIARAGADTINGGTSVTINSANGAYILVSDGTSKWTAQAIGSSAVVGVSSFNGATGGVSTAALQASPAVPTGTTSTAAFVMMGLGGTCKITPTATGRVQINIRGSIANSTNADGAEVQVAFGTGTAPVNGAAASGTVVGAFVRADQNNANAGNVRNVFNVGGVVTGLTVSTQIWIDAQLKALGGGTASILDAVSCDAIEF